MRAILFTMAVLAAAGRADEYNPLEPVADMSFAPMDVMVQDEVRNRGIPIRIYLPQPAINAPVILFSHGLGGSREGYRYLGEHWASRGYVVVAMQHPGSDEAVWKEVPGRERMAAMKKAASGQNFLLRVQDVSAVIDALERWNAGPGNDLNGAMALDRIGMSGHSFGAKTAQAVGGQSFRGENRFVEPRIRAALALSPSPPERVGSAESAAPAFSGVAIPWLLMTGTRDESRIGSTTPESRTWVYPALPPGRKYQLILDGAEHSAFSDRSLRGQERNPNHHPAIQAISTAFWDATLNENPAAQAWLEGEAVREVLQENDAWEFK